MLDLTLLFNLAVAMALGLFIGLERERSAGKGDSLAGIRTFPFFAAFGFLSALLGELVSLWFLLLAFLCIIILIGISYYVTASKNQLGLTTEMAVFLTFLLGILVYYQYVVFAVIVAVLMVMLLTLKTFLHRFAKNLSPEELQSALKFAVVTLIVLPLLPNQAYGPLGIFNPYKIWLTVVLVSAVSFAGYVLYKGLGNRGLALTGLVGGLVSSTAVTTSFSEKSKQTNDYCPLIIGILAAIGVMSLRVLLWIFLIAPFLLKELWLPILSVAVTAALFSLFLYHKREKRPAKTQVDLSSPFTLAPALKFGLLYLAITAASKLGNLYLQSKGLYLTALFSGFVDIDAITLTVSGLSKSGEIAATVAAATIMTAFITNTAIKGIYSYIFGAKRFAIQFSVILGIILGISILLMVLF